MTDQLPATMQVVEISRPGGPDVLQPAVRPVPVPRAGEVVIRVHTAGVNRPDCLQRAGSYNPPPGASDLPGLEVSGTIVAIGPEVDEWVVGDAVCALTPGGGYAQFCATPAAHCLPIPAGLDLAQAASLPETFFTVWINVFERAALRPAETLLVQGGGSGIGVTAIQMARAFGNRVFATAGSAEKCAACEELGAERAINYRTEDFVAVVKELTGGKGVDVILDMVGGDYVARNYHAAATDGRIVQIATQGGAVASTDFARLMVKRLTHTGSTLRPRTVEFKGAIAAALEANVWPLLAERKVAPVMDMIFPLTEAWRAHERMEESEHIGKIVLDVA